MTRVYEHVHRAILDAKLPVGSALSEYRLAEEIGVSRTPVREALKRLEQDGLVHSIPRRGTFVADLTARGIVEIYEVRSQLEGFAARVAAERMDRAEVKRLIAELDRVQKRSDNSDPKAAQEHDIHVHKGIVAAASNDRLTQILATLDDQVYRIRRRAMANSSRLPTTLAEHRRILGAILDHDPEAAERAMREHLQSAMENAIQQALAGTTF